MAAARGGRCRALLPLCLGQGGAGVYDRTASCAGGDPRAFLVAAFLLAVGRTEEAKQSVTFRENTTPKARFTSYLRPVFLYVLREPKAAYDNLTLQSPFFFDIVSRFEYVCGDEIVPFDDWPVEILMALLCLALDQVKAGMRYAQAFNGLVVTTLGGGECLQGCKRGCSVVSGATGNGNALAKPGVAGAGLYGRGKNGRGSCQAERGLRDRESTDGLAASLASIRFPAGS